jgi:GntR family transcriptional regulator
VPRQPAYVRIAGEIARNIRGGTLPTGSQLPSYPELAAQHSVSEIVIRQAIALLRSQGLVRTVERRGAFVADRPSLVRVAPERQAETAETSYANESSNVQVDREEHEVTAPPDVAEMLGVSAGSNITCAVTRVAADGRPASISTTYLIPDDPRKVTDLEETYAQRLPADEHAAWLGASPGETAPTIQQRFLTSNDEAVMVSTISYPRDRYEAFVFRMKLPQQSETDA